MKMAMSVIDVIDPVDYEEYVEEHRSKIESDPIRHLLEYPHDDIDFVRIERQYRTIIPVMPEKEFDRLSHLMIHTVSILFSRALRGIARKPRPALLNGPHRFG